MAGAIIGVMFGLGKKALYARMNNYVDIVQLALYHAT